MQMRSRWLLYEVVCSMMHCRCLTQLLNCSITAKLSVNNCFPHNSVWETCSQKAGADACVILKQADPISIQRYDIVSETEILLSWCNVTVNYWEMPDWWSSLLLFHFIFFTRVNSAQILFPIQEHWNEGANSFIFAWNWKYLHLNINVGTRDW